MLYSSWKITLMKSDSDYIGITPMQIYRKISPKKTEKFQLKALIFFSYFCSKHRLCVLVRTASTK